MSSPWPQIHLLDPTVADQIAAGEVVERPASVVKELVENSLDAGATRVHVLLEDGGRSLIRVVDNGHGLDGPSARLAFARHATSKLRTAEELTRIASFGFRGEALASILAVSRVTLISRRPDADVGVRLRGEGGVLQPAEPAGGPVGTDLTIADLFYNVPARLKFLRTPSTELGQVLRYVDALALARPDLHLTVTHGAAGGAGRKVCDYTPDPDLHRRAYAVLGREVAERLHPIEDLQEYQVRGLLSDPGLHHAGPGQLVLLVGGRPVSDRTLQHAIAAAYGPLLERGRYPVGVVHLSCPPDTVDVNVHPAKTEVRFVSSQAVHAAVTRAIRPMLAETPWVKTALQQPVPLPAVRSMPARPPSPRSWGPPPERTPRERLPQPLDPPPVPQPLPNLAPAAGPWSSLRYVGQVGRCFLVCESGEAMVLVDQHAAHERVLFERFVQGIRQAPLAAQALLVPVAVPLAPEELGALTEAQDLLHRLGFDVEPSGERMVRVRAHPVLLKPRDLAMEVRALAASLLGGGRGQATTERLERAAATLACHTAVRAGDPMTPSEVADLLRAMDGVDLAAYCPHGRPVVWKARLDEVGRWFQRT